MRENTERKEQKTAETFYSVGEVSAMFGISRKTLFHYDRIGLLKPSARIGVQEYKVYDKPALERLRSILAYKEAGLKLNEIQQIFACPSRTLEILRQTEKRLCESCTEIAYHIRKVQEMIRLENEKEKNL